MWLFVKIVKVMKTWTAYFTGTRQGRGVANAPHLSKKRNPVYFPRFCPDCVHFRVRVHNPVPTLEGVNVPTLEHSFLKNPLYSFQKLSRAHLSESKIVV